MPHIHTHPGEIDFTADTFVVYVPEKRVLIRYHDKHDMWLVPGGHVELNETPVAAAMREVKEETGLEITLWHGNQLFEYQDERYTELIPPIAMNVHDITPGHRHISLIYFATASTMEIVEPENEKSRGYLWLTKEELLAHPQIHDTIKRYGIKALMTLAS
jgi:ADP-ribose pyrophosphatase YjhB (NUDIX family)